MQNGTINYEDQLACISFVRCLSIADRWTLFYFYSLTRLFSGYFYRSSRSNKMAKFLVLGILVFCYISLAFCETEEIDAESEPHQSLVIDPDVAEEMRKEKEQEKYLKPDIPNKKEELKPEIEVLYVPKNCKRKSSRGDLMVVHYTGWLAKSGRKFDTTIEVRRRYAPFEFVIGTGYVIRAWDTGLINMCPGEKRRLKVPPSLGYGKKGLRGIIPPNATLIFVVDLMDLRRATPNYAPMDLFTSLDKDGDRMLSRDEISSYVKYQSKMYRNKNAPKPSPEEHEKMVGDIMEKEDKNGDGLIQHSEFSGPKIPHGGEL